MAEGLQIDIVSPERLVLSQTVRAVSVPGTEGYFTVMADHAPFMSTLKAGFITVTLEGGESESFFVRGGFADVSPTGLTILAESATPFAEFDLATIEAEIVQAEKDLAEAEGPEARALAQDRVLGLRNLLLEAQSLGRAPAH